MVIEPTVSQILLCGNFSKKTINEIMKANSVALFILNGGFEELEAKEPTIKRLKRRVLGGKHIRTNKFNRTSGTNPPAFLGGYTRPLTEDEQKEERQ